MGLILDGKLENITITRTRHISANQSLEFTVNRRDMTQKTDGRMSVSFSNNFSDDVFAFGSISSEDPENNLVIDGFH